MKTLQNNFTTPEQSKRLLELGLPVDSADCILRHYNWADEDLKEENWENPVIINKGISPSEAMDMFLDDEYDMTMPCWSVGRLREIFCICSSVNGTREYPFCNSQVAWWITEFEYKKEFIDFSKLEE